MTVEDLLKPKTPVLSGPRVLLFYSQPKMGKTTLVSKLPGAFIVDFEKGTSYLECANKQVDSLKEYVDICDTFKKSGKKADFCVLDTTSSLEEMCLTLAANMYRQLPIGKTWTGTDILTLDRGAGYYFLRKAFEMMLNRASDISDKIILIAHLRDKIVEKEGNEIQVNDIDLTGKIRTNLCKNSDAIGYLYRKAEKGDKTGSNKMFLSFRNLDDNISCGARPNHLKNQNIHIATSTGEGELTEVFWDRVYPELTSN